MKKAYFHTFGCKVNQYETQLLREYVERSGYVSTKNEAEADVIYINTCTVTGESDRQCRQLIRKVSKKNEKARIVVTGCYAVRSSEEIKEISDRVEILIDKNVYAKSDDPKTKNSSITGFSGHSRAFVKIQDGCDAFCTYCIVPYVRSELYSRPSEEIVGEIEDLVKQGYAEIVLSGVRLGRYDEGLDVLLEKICNIKEKFRVRLSSIEIMEVSDGLLKVMNSRNDKVCAHLHIPLQSGSDDVLKRMHRPYSTKEFSEKLELIKKQLPEAGITTDIMVGFPGETDNDFKSTYDFLVSQGFSRLHVFRFSPRTGTVAENLPEKVLQSTINERSVILKELDKKLQAEFWSRFIGTSRHAVAEGSKNSVLTDNYIRLNYNNDTKINNIFEVNIEERAGQPWGVRIK